MLPFPPSTAIVSVASPCHRLSTVKRWPKLACVAICRGRDRGARRLAKVIRDSAPISLRGLYNCSLASLLRPFHRLPRRATAIRNTCSQGYLQPLPHASQKTSNELVRTRSSRFAGISGTDSHRSFRLRPNPRGSRSCSSSVGYLTGPIATSSNSAGRSQDF